MWNGLTTDERRVRRVWESGDDDDDQDDGGDVHCGNNWNHLKNSVTLCRLFCVHVALYASAVGTEVPGPISFVNSKMRVRVCLRCVANWRKMLAHDCYRFVYRMCKDGCCVTFVWDFSHQIQFILFMWNWRPIRFEQRPTQRNRALSKRFSSFSLTPACLGLHFFWHIPANVLHSTNICLWYPTDGVWIK